MVDFRSPDSPAHRLVDGPEVCEGRGALRGHGGDDPGDAASPGRSRPFINNFDPWELDAAPDGGTPDPGTLRLVFAGNLGQFQGLDHVLCLIELLADDPRIEFHFFGDGARAREVRGVCRSASRRSSCTVIARDARWPTSCAITQT